MTEFTCDTCGTVCKLAPGIGYYCPNQECEVMDWGFSKND